jgi:hypothetical protein
VTDHPNPDPHSSECLKVPIENYQLMDADSILQDRNAQKIIWTVTILGTVTSNTLSKFIYVIKMKLKPPALLQTSYLSNEINKDTKISWYSTLSLLKWNWNLIRPYYKLHIYPMKSIRTPKCRETTTLSLLRYWPATQLTLLHKYRKIIYFSQ